MSKHREALTRIRDLPNGDLGEAVERARDELFRLKLSSYTNQVQDTASVRAKRRELARILTIKVGREQGLEAQGAGAGTEGENALRESTSVDAGDEATVQSQKSAAKKPAAKKPAAKAPVAKKPAAAKAPAAKKAASKTPKKKEE